MFRFPWAGGFVLEGRVVHIHIKNMWVFCWFEKAAVRAERGGERYIHSVRKFNNYVYSGKAEGHNAEEEDVLFVHGRMRRTGAIA